MNLLQSCFNPAGSVIKWDFDREITEALPQHTHDTCPPSSTFVPSHLRGIIITWAHTGPASGHPGFQHPMNLLSGKYCWPRMRNDVQKFVTSFSSWSYAHFLQANSCHCLYHNAHGHISPLISPRISLNLQV